MPTLIACLLFGMLEALQLVLQGTTIGGVKVPTELNRADGLTKVLPRASFEEFFHWQLMGGSNTTSPAAPTTPRGASQDDVATDSISSGEEQGG